jgi:hypothetical protein
MKPMLKSLRPKKDFFPEKCWLFFWRIERRACKLRRPNYCCPNLYLSVRSYSFKVPELFLFLCRHKTVFLDETTKNWRQKQRTNNTDDDWKPSDNNYQVELVLLDAAVPPSVPFLSLSFSLVAWIPRKVGILVK